MLGLAFFGWSFVELCIYYDQLVLHYYRNSLADQSVYFVYLRHFTPVIYSTPPASMGEKSLWR
ncbi:hypothetical protein HMPREF3098_01345 [Corynebacterium sp. HMSC28B08]|nr:hypothetical protein HMPREF3098_01345 [Corynebacterium sp. HMSC28B08]